MAYASALACTLAACAHQRIPLPNAKMSGSPGSLEKLYNAEPHEQPKGLVGCPPEPAASDITEIGIEHTSCYGYCPMETFIVRADGTATYHGEGNVEHAGDRQGTIDPALFQSLALLASDLGIPEMTDFSCSITDSPTTYLSIARNGKRKVIRHYAPDTTGPPRLSWFESLVDQLEDRVKWRR